MLLCSNDLKKNNKLYDPGGGMSRVELIAIECDEPAGCHSNFKSCKKKKKTIKKTYRRWLETQTWLDPQPCYSGGGGSHHRLAIVVVVVVEVTVVPIIIKIRKTLIK